MNIQKCYISKSYRINKSIDHNFLFKILSNLKPVNVSNNQILEVVKYTFPNMPLIQLNKSSYKVVFLGMTPALRTLLFLCNL
jgi:hypothetical protein